MALVFCSLEQVIFISDRLRSTVSSACYVTDQVLICEKAEWVKAFLSGLSDDSIDFKNITIPYIAVAPVFEQALGSYVEHTDFERISLAGFLSFVKENKNSLKEIGCADFKASDTMNLNL